MRRRDRTSGPVETIPAELLRFRYADWADESERPPSHWAQVREWPTWHHLRAWRRYLDARRAWCAGHGQDYAETFHPEWTHWTQRGG